MLDSVCTSNLLAYIFYCETETLDIERYQTLTIVISCYVYFYRCYCVCVIPSFLLCCDIINILGFLGCVCVCVCVCISNLLVLQVLFLESSVGLDM